MQQTAVPAPTALKPSNVTVNGQPVASAYEVYQGFRAARRELQRQMDGLNEQRQDIANQLSNQATTGADRKGLEQRMTNIDQRISDLDKAIAAADAEVAKAAAVPGAAVDPPEPPRTGPPEGAWVLGGLFMIIVLLPLTIAYSRRLWRRGAQVVTSIPKELSERLMRVEQTVESSAIEIERIGEGQRFMTRLLSEGAIPQHALPSAQPVGVQTSRPGDVRP